MSVISKFSASDSPFALAQVTQGSPYTTVIFMLAILVIFYLFMVRPQQKRQKELKKKIDAFVKGDRFITAGGLYATVVAVQPQSIISKIADNVKVEISKSAIAVVLEQPVQP